MQTKIKPNTAWTKTKTTLSNKDINALFNQLLNAMQAKNLINKSMPLVARWLEQPNETHSHLTTSPKLEHGTPGRLQGQTKSECLANRQKRQTKGTGNTGKQNYWKKQTKTKQKHPKETCGTMNEKTKNTIQILLQNIGHLGNRERPTKTPATQRILKWQPHWHMCYDRD